MNQTYKSHAKWTKCDESQDTHDSFEMAKAIAFSLYRRWNFSKPPCEIRGHCKFSWVTKNGKTIWTNSKGKVSEPNTK